MKKLLLTALFGAGVFGFGFSQTIFSEDFEGGSIPAGWSQVTQATDGGWVVGDNVTLQSVGLPIDPHTKMAGTNDDKCNCNKNLDLLSTPSMDFTGYTNVFFSYDCYYFNAIYQGVAESAKIVASTDNGVTWTDVVTVGANNAGWQTNYVDLSAYAGNSNVRVGFKYSDGGGWLYGWAIDNVVAYAPIAGTDVSVTSTVVGTLDARPLFVGFPKYLTSLPLTIKTTIINLGTTTINSFDYSWTDGTNTNNQTETGLTIAPLGQYTFSATVPYTTLAGNASITSSLTNINSGAVELSTANNSAVYAVEGITPHPDKKYFAEEATGRWCTWCPRGAVFMDYMKSKYPDQFVGVAVHNNDVMTVASYDAGMGGLIAGYPSVVANGNNVIDPSELEGDFFDVVPNAPQVIINGIATLNIATSQLTIDLTGTFNTNLTGDYRFMAVIVEDSVTGTGANYTQINSYAGGGNGPMGGFELLPATVPAAQMQYDFVGRELLGTFNGQSGSIPTNIVSGTPYTYQFTSPVAVTWHQNMLSVAAVVITGSGANRQVLNAVTIPIDFSTGVKDVSTALNGSDIFPTATQDVINLNLSMENTNQVTITVTDLMGKTILSQNLGTVQKGTQEMSWNVSSLISGMYFLNIITPEGKLSQKFIRQ